MPHDAIDHAEAQARAAVRRLGREERLEHPRQHVRLHAGTVVAHIDANVVAAAALTLRRFGIGELDSLEAHDDEPTGLRRVTRVGHEVHQHLLHLHAIGHDPPAQRAGHDLQSAVRAEDTLERGRELADDGADVDDRGCQDLLTAEGEELPSDRRGAGTRLDDLVDVAGR